MFTVGDELIAEMKSIVKSQLKLLYPDEEDEIENEEEDECEARGEDQDNKSQFWFAAIRMLLHVGVLKNDCENGVGYRLKNSGMSTNHPMFKDLMYSTREL